MTHLTERQAWLKIREACSMPKSRRTAKEKRMTQGTIFSATEVLWWEEDITTTVVNNMEKKIPFQAIHNVPNLVLVDFCYLMALACEDE